MNLVKLFELQSILDNRILTEKQITPESVIHKLILALVVELAELANEWQGFKFWKVNPQPKEKMLEEFVDGEHFFISLALKLGIPPQEYYTYDLEIMDETEDVFTEIIHHVTMSRFVPDKKRKIVNLTMAHALFLNLATQRLGFTWQQIEQAYLDKNQINHQRQEQGY